jgi:exodeoxyribonuclease VII large subunit
MENDCMESQPTALTVSQLNRRARQLLETHLPMVWVEGEISNFSRPGSGHWYLTLKDEQAQVRCAMFRNRNNLIRFRPENGTHVLMRCRVSLYEGRGDFQLIIEHMEEAGYGALQRQFDELKLRLSKEGLFQEAHKQPLPSLPRRIGVITSPTGAAIRDVLSVLKRRFPAIPVTVYPSIVQGTGAAAQLADTIALANEGQVNGKRRCDVLIVGRGGGSMEDLWAFNEEVLARAIYDSDIPVVSAVGHEVDFTIADFVADYRAPTPSAAAEVLSPDRDEFLATFRGFEQLLLETVQRRLQSSSQRIDNLRRQLRHPGERLHHWRQQLQNLQLRLKQSTVMNLAQQQSRLQHLQSKLNQVHPSQQLDQFNLQLEVLHQRLCRGINNIIEQKNDRWKNSAQLLHTVSPLNTLQRGYAIVMDRQQHIVRHTSDAAVGEQVSTKLIDGSLLCTVDKIIPEAS